MIHRFHQHIQSVLQLQRAHRTLNYYSVWGLIAAAPVMWFSPMFGLLILFTCILFGLTRPGSPSAAARLIDQHYHLKDRTLTAVALLEQTDRTPMQQLQVEDAAHHIMAIQPGAVQPVRFTKTFYSAVLIYFTIGLAIAYVPGLFSRSPDTIELVTQSLPRGNAAALEEIAEKTGELVQKHTSEPSLQQLSDRMERLIEKIDWANADIRESLAALSEMEAAFQSVIDSLRLETMDTSLRELARTLELAEPTLPISRALDKGDYSQAAWELKKLDTDMLESLTQPERKAMAEQMQALAESAEDRNQKPLQEAAQMLSDALESGDGEQAKAATDALAGEVEKHEVRQEISKDLANQLMRMAMIKAEGGGEGNMSGGIGTDKSETAKDTWGFGAAGNPNAGEATDLQGERLQETLTGILGEEGAAETEMIEVEDFRAESRLRYREQFQHYQRISEAVLDSEPIPLGQRQVIRRYFEAIRPIAE